MFVIYDMLIGRELILIAIQQTHNKNVDI
jgi:hypothetical protein